MVNITKDNELLDLYLHNARTSCELMGTIKEVLKTFNNKVFNARVKNKVEEALNAGKPVTEHIYFYIELDKQNLKMYLAFYNHRMLHVENGCVYLPHSYEKIDLIPYTSSGYNPYYREKNDSYYARQDGVYFWIDGNNLRMNTNYICDLLDAGRQAIFEEIARITEDRKRFAEYETKRQELVKQLRELQENMSYTVKAMYGSKDYNTYI